MYHISSSTLKKCTTTPIQNVSNRENGGWGWGRKDGAAAVYGNSLYFLFNFLCKPKMF